jgi:hypothetical protein
MVLIPPGAVGLKFWAPGPLPSLYNGDLAVAETADVAAFTGDYIVLVVLAATEAPDIAVFAGSYGVTGTLATTEAPDVAALAGTISDQGTLVATETADAAAFAGSVTGAANILAAIETSDVAAFNASFTVPIVGVATTICPPAGPFKSSAGNFYFFQRDGTTATTLQAYKATVPDASWASVKTLTGFTTAILSVSAYQVGDVIHLLVMDGTSPTLVGHKYRTFNMASDAFVTSETAYAAANIQGGITSGYTSSLVVRSTGEVVAFFNGAQLKVGGNQRARVYYSRRTAPGVWSSAIEVDAAGAFDYARPVIVLGLSDAVHLLFTDAVNAGKQRTLSAANALQTVSSIALGALPHQPPYALSYLSAGVQKVVAAEEAGNTSADAWHFDSGNTPAVVRTVVATAQVPPVRVYNDGTDVYLVYRDASADLQLKKSTDNGATWGSPTNIFTGTVANFDYGLSIGNTYARGGNIVLPYLVVDGGALKYGQWQLRVVSNTGTLVVTETPDTAAFAGNAGSSGVLAATEKFDVAAFTGSGIISGTLAATETADVASIAGNFGVVGFLAASEAPDVAAINGALGISGVLAATEAFDVASISGPATVSGTLTAFEFPDQARFSGAAFIEMVLVASEAPDHVSIIGGAGTSGVLAATETQDVATLSGAGVIQGVLAAVETADTAALAGGAGVSGVLVASEASDAAVLVGDFKIATGILAATEAPDVAAFVGVIVNNASGILVAIERPDNCVILANYQRPPGAPLTDETDYDYDWFQREPIRRRRQG